MRLVNRLLNGFGQNNSSLREEMVIKCLSSIPALSLILDAGAGEQIYKRYCQHLSYISQDFCQYNGIGNSIGLQTVAFDTDAIDIVSDLVSIPFKDEHFDAIMCTEVFEHIPDPIKAFNELDRLLKPGGYILITAPFNSLTHFAPYHFCSGFNKYFFQNLFKNSFEIIEITPYGNYFEVLAQELLRISSVTKQYLNKDINFFLKIYIIVLTFILKEN
ncbi:methyltransferase domain-containing protein [Spirosoma fluviale]|uniref:Methyltransferase domain-containing protein n=1 Tax=Spirosoma fluviale TaxID=1597977 RepID=A0A286FDB5_9BACT|nr:methyltransferase domain-containing protein [Spirosoma fluviale]SOD81237.1 Methyltransferase domain-containing protein [Spirosoma fluviale]